VSYGSLRQRWVHGVHWTWINEHYRARLPHDFAAGVMSIETRDRYHTKQGRSTARVVLKESDGALAVYLKRHFRLPWPARLAALFDPGGKHWPAASEWAHLEHVRALGIEVPEVVAAGEHIGPRAALSSFLMVAELSGCSPLNESLPELKGRLDARAFATLKRQVIAEMARITATLHAARVFHKDLYLCHFFHSAITEQSGTIPPRVVLIDLHRLEKHRFCSDWWRWKDLGQLLFSTDEVAGITPVDRLRFWKLYCRRLGIKWPGWHAQMVRLRAARYREHNRKRR
jgi:heptose I phosphotransferase